MRKRPIFERRPIKGRADRAELCFFVLVLVRFVCIIVVLGGVLVGRSHAFQRDMHAAVERGAGGRQNTHHPKFGVFMRVRIVGHAMLNWKAGL